MKRIGVIAALAAGCCLMATAAARADLIVDYSWHQASTTIGGFTSTGSLSYDATLGTVLSLSFTESNAGQNYVGTVNNFGTFFNGTTVSGPGVATVLFPGLPSGDLQLIGASSGTSQVNAGPASLLIVDWFPNGVISSTTEQGVTDNTTLTGAWVPVPEPSTVLAGALLILPMGAGMLRVLRKNRMA